MDWARMLAYVTGTVDQELLARNEYLTAENRILKAQLNGRLKLSDGERSTLGEIGHRLGRTALAEVATVAKSDTILAWYRKLVAHKFDGSKARRGPGRPRVTRKVEQLIVRLAEENRDWGYDRIAGALANLGYRVCHQTVGNVLQRHGLPPAPERKFHSVLLSASQSDRAVVGPHAQKRHPQQNLEICAQFADAALNFLHEKVPCNCAEFCDSVTDNFRVISEGFSGGDLNRVWNPVGPTCPIFVRHDGSCLRTQ
jgi:Homeodomain-like domain